MSGFSADEVDVSLREFRLCLYSRKSYGTNVCGVLVFTDHEPTGNIYYLGQGGQGNRLVWSFLDFELPMESFTHTARSTRGRHVIPNPSS